MVFSSLYSMVGRNSIMAHRDAELKRGGDHLIGVCQNPVTGGKYASGFRVYAALRPE
jgi:hypothetical protein